MRNSIKRIGTILLAFGILLTSFGCVSPTRQFDKNKKQVFVSIFNGGFGYDWLETSAQEFNEANPATEIIILPNPDAYTKIRSDLESGVSIYDIYFTNTPLIKEIAALGLVEPLDDVYEMKPDEGIDRTIAEKIIKLDSFKSAFSHKDNIYALPNTDAMQGFIYDHDLFVENDWLFTNPDGSLTLGKDGKAGTYDDGLPVDIEEWEELLANIKSTGIYPFIWNRKFTDYLISINEAMWAQYDGIENYMISYNYDGTYTNPSTGEQTLITPATGYLAYQMEGKRKAIDFVDTYMTGRYFTGAQEYIHPKAKLLGTSHRDAQDSYILGYKNDPDNPRSAMIVEGVWWENEARTTFNSLYNKGDATQKYGTRDFRFMPLPNMEGGDNSVSVFNISENATIFIKKQKDPVKLDAAKRFIAYTCSDKVLKRFTLATNGMKPYDYTLTPDELSQLTNLGRNAYEIYHDTEHVALIRTSLERYISPMNYATTPSAQRWLAKVGNSTPNEAFVALQTLNAEDYWEELLDYNNAEYWKRIYDQI